MSLRILLTKKLEAFCDALEMLTVAVQQLEARVALLEATMPAVLDHLRSLEATALRRTDLPELPDLGESRPEPIGNCPSCLGLGLVNKAGFAGAVQCDDCGGSGNKP